MNTEILRAMLGWSLAINVGIMLASTIFLTVLKGWASRLHANMFGLDEAWVRQSYFTYLANYKIAVIVFNLVPWLALYFVGG